MQVYGNKGLLVPVLSYLTAIGITTDLRLPPPKGEGLSVEELVLFAGLCVLYASMFRRIGKAAWALRDKVCVAIPAILFAAFMVVGYSFAQTESLDLVLGNKAERVMKFFAGYGIGFSVSIAWLYAWLAGLDLSTRGQFSEKGSLGHL